MSGMCAPPDDQKVIKERRRAEKKFRYTRTFFIVDFHLMHDFVKLNSTGFPCRSAHASTASGQTEIEWSRPCCVWGRSQGLASTIRMHATRTLRRRSAVFI
jgi:hypothetical protein